MCVRLSSPVPEQDSLWSGAGPRLGCVHTAWLVTPLWTDSCRRHVGAGRSAEERGCGVQRQQCLQGQQRGPAAEDWRERAGCAVSILGAEPSSCAVPTGVWRLGEGNGACQLLCSWRGLPRISVPVMSKQTSLPYASGLLQTCIHAESPACVVFCLFKGRDSVSSPPPGSPRAQLADFLKFQVLIPTDCKNSQS